VAEPTVALTEREAAVLSALANGMSNKAIGAELRISERTVKSNLTRIYRKLGVSNRGEAIRLAHRPGFEDGEGHAGAGVYVNRENR
jgi:DNA-binding NarL/FixJ family response regulator